MHFGQYYIGLIFFCTAVTRSMGVGITHYAHPAQMPGL